MQKVLSDKQVLMIIREPGAPATPSQLAYMGSLKIPAVAGMTKGEAALLIRHNLNKR